MLIPTVEEMMTMAPEDFSELLRQDHSREESRELLIRETAATIKRFGLRGPIKHASIGRFWRVHVILPYKVAPETPPPDWSPLADPRLLKAESCEVQSSWTLVTLNGHPEWSNERVIAAELAERRRLNAPAPAGDKY